MSAEPNVPEPVPEVVVDALRTATITEFVTVTRGGDPIDTPLLCFVRDGGMVEVTTGLAYPAKANRARRNPKVGLLVEPGKDPWGANSGPTVLIAAQASVRDADLAANSNRYAREPLARMAAGASDWARGREAVWYFTRIWIQCYPVRIWWWYGTEDAPNQWNAPSTADIPESDPAPVSSGGMRSDWEVADIEARQTAVLEAGTLPHLTLVDPAGWPLPVRTREVSVADQGFTLKLPSWVPWAPTGRACLSFPPAAATFVGTASSSGVDVHFSIDRLLPDLPMTQDPSQVMDPADNTYRRLMARLSQELDARGQALPNLPNDL